jgi:hypothetical protein
MLMGGFHDRLIWESAKRRNKAIAPYELVSLGAPENQRICRLSAPRNGAHTLDMISTFRRLILLSVLSALVAACTTSPEQQAQRDDERCAARGYKPLTKEHDDCVIGLQASRDVRLQRRHRELVERPAATPYGR